MDDLRYRVALDFRPDSLEFRGRVEIRARELPSSLSLDAVGQVVRSVRANGTPLAFERDDRAGRLVIPSVPPGAPSVEIDFDGRADDRGLRGFYVSPYGPDRLLTTYFEPTAARRFLPCLDRPDAKAAFTLEVTVPSGASVVSNMPSAEETALPDGRRRVLFPPTPPMSTYLLYLGIGRVDEIRSERNDPRVIVTAPPGRAEGGRFALAEASRDLDYFARYYGAAYPLPKLHLVAVPRFGTGAMENWGAIAFQEYLLLLGDRAPTSARMRLAEVLAHEIAHQWFGDLVTMRWWNDLWLNESFASFVGIKALAELHPEWNPWDDFLRQRLSGAMLWDALPHTHAVRVEVQEPEQIRQIFDEVTYGKGASILRMGEAFLGEEAFRNGVSRYIATHREGNADSDDLWRAVAASSDAPVERIFGEWVSRPGFPVVRARLDGSALRLEQRRFTLGAPTDDRPWPIPLTVRVGGTTHRRLFDGPRTELPIEEGAVALVNPGRTGFYRVQYDDALRRRLLAELPRLPAIDRWGVASDDLAFLFAGTVELDTYLDRFALLATETEPLVISECVSLYGGLFPLVHRIPRWEAALRRVVVAQVDRLGVENVPDEPEAVRLLREGLLVARVGLDPAFAATLAQSYARLDALDPERVRPVLRAVAGRAGPAEYAALRERLAHAPSPERARQLASALGVLPRGDWLRESLGLLLSEELQIGTWLDLAVSAAMTNPDRSTTVWSFLKERADELLALTAGTPIPGRLLQVAIPVLAIDRPAEATAWVSSRAFPECERAVEKGLDLLAVYGRVLERAR